MGGDGFVDYYTMQRAALVKMEHLVLPATPRGVEATEGGLRPPGFVAMTH